MNQFTFRLQSVIQLRTRERDAATHSLEQALLAKKTLEEQIEQLLQERVAQQPVQTESINGIVDAQLLLESQRYQMHLMQQVDELRSKCQLLDAEIEKRRGVLVEHEKGLRAIEKLRERQFAEWQAEASRHEQNALDQWSGFQHWSAIQSERSSGNVSH